MTEIESQIKSELCPDGIWQLSDRVKSGHVLANIMHVIVQPRQLQVNCWHLSLRVFKT